MNTSSSNFQFSNGYLNEVRGKYLVIKIGGEIAEQQENSHSLVKDLVRLREEGVNVVLCHGGGPQISRALKAKGIETQFVKGHRVTDVATLETTRNVLLGEINPSLVTQIQKGGGKAKGLSGFEERLYLVKLRDPVLGFVGDVTSVNDKLVRKLCDDGYIPVIACLGVTEEGEICNINADSAAASLNLSY